MDERGGVDRLLLGHDAIPLETDRQRWKKDTLSQGA